MFIFWLNAITNIVIFFIKIYNFTNVTHFFYFFKISIVLILMAKVYFFFPSVFLFVFFKSLFFIIIIIFALFDGFTSLNIR